MDNKKQKDLVKEAYSKIAKSSGEQSCCCSTNTTAGEVAKKIGYTDEELKSVPEEANLGLGCGNPTAIANLKPGDTVLDLGSGAGFDCFLASIKVGDGGKVIGVDMTTEMIEKATSNAENAGYKNIEFRLGELEDLPVENDSINVVISNCVINLVPDKEKVFKEVHRVLKKDGKMCVSDITLTRDLPDFIKTSKSAYVACIAGAIKLKDYLALIEKAGFSDIRVVSESSYSCLTEETLDPLGQEAIKECGQDFRIQDFSDCILSVKIEAYKK